MCNRKIREERKDIEYVKNYIWVFLLLVGNFTAYYLLVSNKSDFASNFLLNFGTGLLQTIIIVILIEKKLLKQDEVNRQKMQRYALKSLLTNIYDQMGILITFISSSKISLEELNRQYSSIRDLLKSNYCCESIKTTGFCFNYCDGAISIKKIQNNNNSFKNNLIDMLAIYSSHLDCDLVDSISIILNNYFFNAFNDLIICEMLKSNPDHKFLFLKEQQQSICEYINELIKVIEKNNIYNEKDKIDISISIRDWINKG
jgi:hypothetical protein